MVCIMCVLLDIALTTICLNTQCNIKLHFIYFLLWNIKANWRRWNLFNKLKYLYFSLMLQREINMYTRKAVLDRWRIHVSLTIQVVHFSSFKNIVNSHCFQVKIVCESVRRLHFLNLWSLYTQNKINNSNAKKFNMKHLIYIIFLKRQARNYKS